MKGGQWYPGNMAKAVNQLRQDIKAVDLIIELLDARVPISSCNPFFKQVTGGKDNTVLLHKADRADKKTTAGWLLYLQDRGTNALSFSVFDRQCLKKFFQHIAERRGKLKESHFKRPFRLMIVGIPNVGKSTLINLLVKKSVTRTGNQPGVTRGKQWVRIAPDVDLLDTPGILPKKTEEKQVFPLAAVGAIPRGQFNLQDTALWLIEYYLANNKFYLLADRYGDKGHNTAFDVLKQIGLMHGCLRSHNNIDLERASGVLIKDFQDGLLGKVTLEKPPIIKKTP